MDELQMLRDIVTAVEYQRNEALAKQAQTAAMLAQANREIAALTKAVTISQAVAASMKPDHREHDEN